MVAEMIALDKLTVAGVQTRAELRPLAIQEYAAAIRVGETMEPAVAFNDGAALWLAAGHHRREAYRLAGQTDMPVVVKVGSKLDAIKYGVSDNLQHVGERLSREDKRHAAKLILVEQPSLSDSAVAKLVGISPTTAGRYRSELTFQFGKSDCRVGLDGRTINTSNLGRKPSPLPADDRQTAALPDADLCKCGGEWLSDGEGGRFCGACRKDCPEAHPTGDNSSSVSPAPKKPKPPRMPAADYFKQMERELGGLKRTVDEFGARSKGTAYARMMSFLDQAGAVLAAWKKKETNDERK